MPNVPEMTPAELVGAVEAGEEVHVLDVRAPFRLESGRVDIVPDTDFHNIQGSDLIGMEDVGKAGLDPGKPLLVVCGFGKDSRRIAGYLNENGFEASSLAGGMVAWMNDTVLRELEAPPGLDRFVQLDRIGKGALGYILISGGEALIIDPPRHTVRYLETVDAVGAAVVAIADTHAHADYISGGPTLALALDVPYYLNPEDVVYPYDGTEGRIRYEPAVDGQTIRLGSVELTVVHTPGHTEGSNCYLLDGHSALTGDFLFIRSVGRPDLGGKTEEWTATLWKSLERVRGEWGPDVAIYPAHYSSPAERRQDRSVGGRFGDLPGSNAPLAMADEAEFTAWVKSKAGSFPDAYRKIKAVNVGLLQVDETEAEELEVGRNECALG
jgi:glyoxylase-like metal-dependent hydrolase (beta-lactamase superfamily II)